MKSPYLLAPSGMEELSGQLKELQDKEKFVIVFIDDILIYSRTREEHEMHLGLVLELLKKEKLPHKIEAVKNWEAPRTSSEDHSFLGLEKAFQTLKDKLCNAPVLALLDGPKDFVVYCNASGLGLGYVLMQRGKVIAYARQLKIHEKNYTTYDLELDAVVFALKIWRHYFYKTKSVIYTDQKSFQHIFNQKELNMRQRCWIELFSDYDCQIRYHPCKANVVADELSRKERIKPRRIRAMNMTLQSSIKDKILAAQEDASDESGYVLVARNEKGYSCACEQMLTCLKVNAEHQRPSGLMQQPEIPEWKWERIAMDFVTKLPRTSSGHDIIWVIMYQLTKFAHFLHMREDYKMDRLARLYLNEIVARGSWDVYLPLVKFLYNNSYHSSIKDRLKAARDHHKSYADKRRKPLEFSKCLADPTLQVLLDEIQVEAKLNFVKEPVEVLEREFKKLKRSRIAIVKVRWNLKRGLEFM
ncbi:putative reverse transcriptase domain-containing protein [Tanacetum coccineum]